MTGEVLDDLRSQIERSQVVVVVGAGLSVAASGGARVASWGGLLEDGVRRCEEVVPAELHPGWGDLLRAEIGSGDIDNLLSAAEKITRKLGGRTGGEYRRWLRETVGSLRAEHTEGLEAVRALRVPLLTTNYDGLLEAGTSMHPVTWRDGARMHRVIRGDEAGVVHLHGHWDDSESVVLGVRSYQDVTSDEAAQAMQSALATLKSFLLVGFGAGLVDPNFLALRAWMRRFAKSEYRHYRLVRQRDLAEVSQQHDPDERIVPLVYGDEFADLPRFLRGLAVTPPQQRAPGPSVLRARLPPRPRCVGRETQVDDVVQALLTADPPPIAVLGPPGIGKSTVCAAAIHDDRIAERFGERRYFVRWDGARTADAALSKLAAVLGLPVESDMLASVTRLLSQEGAVLVLDNLDVAWTTDLLPTEELLTGLAAIEGLALVVSLRGTARPRGPAWTDAVYVPPLSAFDARRLFLDVAGNAYADDRDLDPLLADLDGLPLAIVLLAHATDGERDLRDLAARWQVERIGLLQRGRGDHPQLSAAASFELSIGSDHMTPVARRLLLLLATLPDGVALHDLPAIAPGSGRGSAATLRHLGLAYDTGERLRMLRPIREYVRSAYPPTSDDLARAVTHYATLAERLGPLIGSSQGAAASTRLALESGNITAMLQEGLERSPERSLIRAALTMAVFARFSGSASVLETAKAAAHRSNDLALEAETLEGLAHIALGNSDRDQAALLYGQARAAYQSLGDGVGEADCVLGLGDVALYDRDYGVARSSYEAALRAYRETASAGIGSANCTKALGNVALDAAAHTDALSLAAAQEHFERAFDLYDEAGSILGRANCMKALGNVHLDRGDHSEAEERYRRAIEMYRAAGDAVGEANCIKGLADVAADAGDDAAARSRYEEAIRLYRRVGYTVAERSCLRALELGRFERTPENRYWEIFSRWP